MNPDPQNQTAAPPVPPPEPSPPTPFAYRGNGKVARLPKPIRDQINQCMLDGVSYPDIIQRLGEHGKDLNPGHLCEWRKRGHQDWLLQQSWFAETRARQEPASDLSTDFDATQLNHAALQLGTLHIFEALRDLAPAPGSRASEPEGETATDPSPSGSGTGNNTQSPSAPPNQNSKIKIQKSRSTLDLRLGGDSAAFVRLINALARASRETMLVQKYRDVCARARTALQELKDPKRKLNESETRAIVLQVDDILGLRSHDDTPARNGQFPESQSDLAPSVSPAAPPPTNPIIQ